METPTPANGPKSPSTYDVLHDALLPNAGTKKPGTRYERLMAVVQASLTGSGTVIHDIRLRGEVSGEQHQIDVLIDDPAGSRRVLMECKDFDIAGKPVGLGIVRDFYGVVADVKPDEAWIVSCNGYTRQARKYAKGFGIQLATLREFREADWEGRLRKLIVTFSVRSAHSLGLNTIHTPRTDLLPVYDAAIRAGGLPTQQENAFVMDTSTVPITAIVGDDRMSFQLFLEQVLQRRLSLTAAGPQNEVVAFDDLSFDFGSAIMPIVALTISYVCSIMEFPLTIEAPGVATLLLIRDKHSDVVVFDTDIRAYVIDDEGKVLSSKSIRA
jgi:hypothetical protein